MRELFRDLLFALKIVAWMAAVAAFAIVFHEVWW